MIHPPLNPAVIPANGSQRTATGGPAATPAPPATAPSWKTARAESWRASANILGKQTNNYAEYSGLLAVLKWAGQHGARRLRVVSDSELMVKQMNGQYRVSNPGLRPLWEEARRLARGLDAFEISHTLRAGNAEADRLANEAMDRGMGKPAESGTSGASPSNRSTAQSAVQPAVSDPRRPTPQPNPTARSSKAT